MQPDLMQQMGGTPSELMGAMHNLPQHQQEVNRFMQGFQDPSMQFGGPQPMPQMSRPMPQMVVPNVHAQMNIPGPEQFDSRNFNEQSQYNEQNWANDFNPSMSQQRAFPIPQHHIPSPMPNMQHLMRQQMMGNMQNMQMMNQMYFNQMQMMGHSMQQVPMPQAHIQRVEAIEEVKDTQIDGKNLTGAGMDSRMLEELKNSGNSKFRNSKFLEFISKVQDGRVTFTDDNRMIEHTAEELAAQRGQATDESDAWAQEFQQSLRPEDLEQEFGNQDDAYENMFGNNASWQEALAKARAEAAAPKDAYKFGQDANPFLDSKDSFADGLALLKAGRLKEAISAFEATVQKQPDHAEAWRYLGQSNAENEEESGAIAALLQCINRDPYNLDALLMLGVSYTNDLEEMRALKYLKTWLLNNPDYQNAGLESDNQAVQEYEELYSSGHSLDEHLHNQVSNMFLKAVTVNPRDADLHTVLGVLYHITQDWDKSIASFKNALKLRPDDAQLWNKLGATQANSGKSAEAMQSYKRALQLRPTYVRALANLAISFANQGLFEDAARTYLATLEKNPNASHIWGYLRIALSHLNRDDLSSLTYQRNVDVFRPHFDF
jgi:peroxin-5